MPHILRIDTSVRLTDSVTRDLTDRIVARLGGDVTRRDLATPLPQIDATWVGANFTPADKRTPDQQAALALSDTLIAELQAADTIVIGVPVYNFGTPSGLKVWVDHIARAGVTFRYTDTGPVGLLTGKRAILAMASGGTQAGSAMDFATVYMRHVLGFVGITDVTVIAADRLAMAADDSLAEAQTSIDALPVAA